MDCTCIVCVVELISFEKAETDTYWLRDILSDKKII